VQVRCTEGLANHSDPESCAGIREGVSEALTGERAGQPLSRERLSSRMPTRFETWKAIRTGALMRAPGRPAWSETLACADASCTGTGRSWVWPAAHCRSVPGRRGAVAGDARIQEV
jgi:hypothetical protein